MKSFPFWKYSLKSPESMMDTLKTQKIKVIQDHGDILIRTYPDDYLECDHISNHFTEYERIKCCFADKPSPLKVWSSIKTNKDFIQLDRHDQREYIYMNSKECNTFNVTFCLWIINKLVGSNAKILDPSSGWGDRLIASIASDANLYHGTDPNIKLQKGYNDIKKKFLSKEKMRNFTIKKYPFEDLKINDNYYDLAITSPPYYNLEKYGNSKHQSINKYGNYEEWLLFYKDYILKMIHAVISGKYIVIYIEDIYSGGKQYTLRKFTIDTVNESGLACNQTKMGLKIGKNTRWALVWQKR
jgi:DNA modification methylase